MRLAAPHAEDGRHASHERIRKLRKVVKLARNPRWRSALRHRVAAAIEHGDVAFEHDFAAIVDVGAHHGQFALFAAERFPGAELHCFEPLPQAQAQLSRVLAGHPRARLVAAAASSAPSRREMRVSRLDDSSSLLPITERYTTAWPGTEEAARLEVETVRLDEAIDVPNLPRPCLLKIDVQGAELEVLNGAERLLAATAEIFLEGSFIEFYEGQPLVAEVIAHLRERGFELIGVFGLKRDRGGRCLQADFLFSSAR